MPRSRELFVNPEMIRSHAAQIRQISGMIKDNLSQVSAKIKSTESIYVAESATEMREKFDTLKPELDKFESYLLKVANYLEQNVAEPAEIVDRVAAQNVASIRKPD